eukprot:2494575-Amphidinium_carterae.1
MFGPPPTQDQARGYGPPTPPDENSDGEPAAHLRTQEDRIRMLEDRLSRNEYEIERRDSLHARAVQAVETRLEEEQQQAIREIIRGDWVRPEPSVESMAARPGTAENDLMIHVMLRDPEVLNLYRPAAVDALPQPAPPRPPPPKQAPA